MTRQIDEANPHHDQAAGLMLVGATGLVPGLILDEEVLTIVGAGAPEFFDSGAFSLRLESVRHVTRSPDSDHGASLRRGPTLSCDRQQFWERNASH